MIVACEQFECSLGEITITASNKGIASLSFDQNPTFFSNTKDYSEASKHIAITKKQLQEYFSGKRSCFTVTLDISGTEFQRNIWELLCEIPFGQTVSYKELAQKNGKPKACRAVGMANKRNPLPIIIPCHRVIGISGKLVGYSGGIERKKWLLEFEKTILKANI